MTETIPNCPYFTGVLSENLCPNCGTNFYAGPIPFEYRWAYGSPYTWNSRIAQYDPEEDRTVSYECPECSHVWPA